jgi:hypothetical protein
MTMVKRLLRALWSGWKRFAHVVGVVNRYILLTLFYFLIVNLTNLILRLFRVDLLDRRLFPAQTYWREKDDRTGEYRHQF